METEQFVAEQRSRGLGGVQVRRPEQTKQDQDQDIRLGGRTVWTAASNKGSQATSKPVQLVGAPLSFHVAVFASLDIVSFLDLT